MASTNFNSHISLLFIIVLSINPSYDLFSQTHFYIYKVKEENLYSKQGKKEVLLKEMSAGNTYLFKSLSIYYTKLDFFFKQKKNNDKIIIKAFGKGKKPIFSLYTKVKPSAFILRNDNIWEVDLSKESNFTGRSIKNNFNIGFLKIDSFIYGGLKLIKDSLKVDGDFFIEKNILYVKYSQKISLKRVKIANNVNGLDLIDNLQIEDICIEGAGGHGIQGKNNQNIFISNLLIREIGGAYLLGYGSGFVRYGNGIEFWNGCTNCLVNNCKIMQVYDAALTIQGEANSIRFDNVHFKGNTLANNEQAFEFWTKGEDNIIHNCSFEENICINSGMGWSHKVRPDTNVGVHILNYTLDSDENDLVISRNRFYKSKNGLVYINDYKNSIVFKADNNFVYGKLLSIIKVKEKVTDTSIINPQLKIIQRGFKFIK